MVFKGPPAIHTTPGFCDRRGISWMWISFAPLQQRSPREFPCSQTCWMCFDELRNVGLAGTWEVTQPSCCTEAKTISGMCLPAVIANLFPRDSLTSLFAFRDSSVCGWEALPDVWATAPLPQTLWDTELFLPFPNPPGAVLLSQTQKFLLTSLTATHQVTLSSFLQVIYLDFVRLYRKILPKSSRSKVRRCWRTCKSQWPCGWPIIWGFSRWYNGIVVSKRNLLGFGHHSAPQDHRLI